MLLPISRLGISHAAFKAKRRSYRVKCSPSLSVLKATQGPDERHKGKRNLTPI